MVLSRLNVGIEYNTDIIDRTKDIGHESSVYEITVKGEDMEIVLGNPDERFLEDYGVIFYTAYLVIGDNVDKKLGIYEIDHKNIEGIIDEDGDVDINKFDDIILFNIEPPLPEMGKSDVKSKPDTPYKRTPDEPWIQTFMRDKNYDILDNEGGGDCLFSSIRDGLHLSGIDMSVIELRTKISDNADEYIYLEYKTLYDFTLSEYNILYKNISKLTSEITSLKKKSLSNIGGTGDTAGKEMIHTKEVELKEVQREMVIQKKQLDEFIFMKGVDSLEKFKSVVKTSNYWGDAWAIISIERLLEVKLVLLNKRAFIERSTESVLTCGENPMNDNLYSPKYYILLNHTGQHYTLVTYKGNGTFTFHQLPDGIKDMVMNTCMERMAGSYYMIREFRDMMKDKSIDIPSDIPYVSIDDTYDEGDVFQYYSRSTHARAGKGNGEKLSDSKSDKYRKLDSITHWRRMLSDHYIEPFDLDSHRWNSVTHYVTANKFKKTDNPFYLQFTLDVNPTGELSNDPNVAIAAGTANGKYKGKQIRPITSKIDDSFIDVQDDVLEKALTAKFSSKTLHNILALTLRSKLQEYRPKQIPIVSNILMKVRKKITE
jgi:predicted NAD-dependent protein-ADP-ribosyltransferase YbiA (DUF1768 family)